MKKKRTNCQRGSLRSMAGLLSLSAMLLLASSPSGAQTVTIGTGTSSTLSTSTTSTSLQSPYNSYYGYSYAQTLYLKTEITSIGNISSIRYYYDGSSLDKSDSMTIYMGHVARSAFASSTDWEPIANLTQVFNGVISGSVPGWVTINLTTAFPYNNVDNLLIAIDENRPGDNGSTGYRASNLGANRVIFYRSDTDNPNPSSPPSASGRSSYVGNIQINGLTLAGCIPLSNPVVGTVTTNTASVSWTAPPGGDPPTQYNWEVRTSGAAGSGATGLVQSGNSPATSADLLSLSPGTTYSFYVRTDCGTGQSPWSAAVPFSTIPANDEATGAIPLTINPTLTCTSTLSATTVAATASSATAPACSATGTNDDVWFSFTASGTAHQVAFSNVTSGTMAVALYTGTPTNLSPVNGACGSGSTVDLQGLTNGTTYYARVYTTSALSTTTTSFTICLGTPANMTYTSSTTTQSSSSSTAAGSANQQIIRNVVVATGLNNALSLTQLNYNTGGSVNPATNIANARVYYTGTSTTFSTTTPFGTAVANPNGTFSVTGSQPLAGSSSGTTNNYFWLVYDISCTATPPDSVDAQCTSLVVGGNTVVPTATNPSGTRSITPIFATSRSDANSTTALTAGAFEAQFVYANITAPGSCNSNATTVNFTVSGTAPASDIAQAKCYYTTSSTFSNATPFGTAIASPAAGTISFTGNQALTTGANYFWLVYDVSCSAIAGNSINGDISSLVVNGVTVTPTGTATSANNINGLITTTQPSTSTSGAGTLNNQVLRVNINPCGASSTITSATFNITGSTSAADIENAKVYYTSSTTFGTTIPFGNAVANPTGSFTVTGNQPITAVGYLWLVYDTRCNATVSNVIDAECTAVVLSGNTFAPATTNPTGTRSITAASYSASITQASTAVAPLGANGQQIVYANLSGCANTPVTSITFTTTGTTNNADIAAARVYYTPTSTFSNLVPFGATITSPGTTMTFTGNQPLTTGTGYFWLVYDISATATVSNVVDASLTAAVINGLNTVPSSTSASGTRTIVTPIANDNASGAITVALGAGCTTASFTNVNASQDGTEVSGNCSDVASYATVWYKFTAPASGAVRISTDVGTGNTLSDSRVSLFAATDPNNYSTFTIIGCDEDGGSQLGSGYMSVLYATGLTSGVTYYIQVGNFSSSTVSGTFCLTVDELNNSMLATANICTSSYQTPIGSGNPGYTGWTPLLDGSSKLIGLVRNTAGAAPAGYTVAQNINTGAVRSDVNGVKYLDRNFRIVNTNAGNYDVQLFMLSTEQTALQNADPAATLGALNITRVTGESGCNNNATGTGTTSLIMQSGSGSAGGVSWVSFTTPGFSNFYINRGTVPLPIVLKDFSGKNAGAVNNLYWETTTEQNFSHFELQRAPDGIQFSTIAQVSSERKNNGSKYAYTDATPFKGMNSYRLKMVDIDGKSTLSQVVRLDVKETRFAGVEAYPNPVQQTLYIRIAGQAAGTATVQLMDMTGKVIRSLQLQGNTATMDTNNMPSGMYLLRYADDSHTSVIKITKE